MIFLHGIISLLGYRPLGTGTSLRCQEDGKWSNDHATCQVRCEPLRPDVDYNGKLKTPACEGNEQEVGQQCKIRCNEGYHAEGERIKRYIYSSGPDKETFLM